MGHAVPSRPAGQAAPDRFALQVVRLASARPTALRNAGQQPAAPAGARFPSDGGHGGSPAASAGAVARAALRPWAHGQCDRNQPETATGSALVGWQSRQRGSPTERARLGRPRSQGTGVGAGGRARPDRLAQGLAGRSAHAAAAPDTCRAGRSPGRAARRCASPIGSLAGVGCRAQHRRQQTAIITHPHESHAPTCPGLQDGLDMILFFSFTCVSS